MSTERLQRLGVTGRGQRAPKPTNESREEWRCLYEAAGSAAALARQLGLNASAVEYHLRRHGISLRSGFRSPKTVVHRGADHPKWKGGTYRHSNGYIYEYAPDHPAAVSAKGYVLQHRLVMERALGRFLTADEIVHHRNEMKDDNRVENLELTTRSPHAKHHRIGVVRDPLGRFV